MQKRSRGTSRKILLLAVLLPALPACEQVVITEADVGEVEITPPVAAVQVDATTTLSALVKGNGGSPLSGRPVSWSSLDPQIASVTNGQVRGLAPGSARIRAASGDVADTAIVHVSSPPPTIALAPATLSFTATKDGENPPARTVSVSEAGGGALGGLGIEIAYPANQPGGWLTASLASSDAPADLTVGIALGSLAAGTYTATVRVGAAAAANSPQSVAVTLVVQPAEPRLALSRPDASFAASVGGANPAAVQITVSNAGGGTLGGLSASVIYAGGQPQGWLGAQLSGTTSPATLTLAASTGSLAPGTYVAHVRLTSSNATNSPLDIPVTFALASVAPGAPTGLQASAASGSQIGLSWTAPAGAAVARYRIERRTGGGAFAVIDSVGGATVTYQDTGLAPATQYAYRVQACNAAGCSSHSNEAQATTSQVAPGAPSGLIAAAASASRIDLSWTAAAGAVTWYRIERRSNGAFAVIDSVGGGATSFQNTGLAAGTHFTYQVLACNAAGCSDPSNQASATTHQVPPGAPTNLVATASASPLRVTLQWNAADGAVTSYHVERRSGGSGFAEIAELPNTAASHVDNGVAAGTQYEYRVKACNPAGCAESNTASATTAHPVPGAPTNLAATAVSASRIDLSWSAASGTVERYRIERRSGGAAFAVIDSVQGGTTTYQSTGLAAATEYTYRVLACNAGGCSGPSNEASAKTNEPSSSPSTPANVGATPASPTEVRVSWGATAGATSYRVQWRQAGEGWGHRPVATTPGDVTSHTVGGLAPATTYQFRVEACNAAGCSGFSSAETATTLSESALDTATLRAARE